MIDTTKPWFPQDYTLEEVLAICKKQKFESDENYKDRLAAVERDYNDRVRGVAGIFDDLRRNVVKQIDLLNKEGPLDLAKVQRDVDCIVANALYKLEGGTIQDTKFVVMEYAVPVFNRDSPPNYECHTTLKEETRHATALGDTIMEKYWNMVNT